MVQVAAKQGYGRASIDEAVRLSGFGKATFYKLFESRDACLLEAFERCAEVLRRRVGEAVASEADSVAKTKTGLLALTETLAAEPDVAHLMLVEIRVGGMACRQAQQRWLGEIAALLGEANEGDRAGVGRTTGRMVAGALRR